MFISSSTSSRAQNLPPETLDRIFGFCFSTLSSSSSSNSIPGRPVTKKRLPLVCRSWRGPAQRHLLREVQVQTVTQLRQWKKVKVQVAQFVQKVTVNVTRKDIKWSAQDLAPLLASLPRLKTLVLHLNAQSPGDYASYLLIPKLPQVETLVLVSSTYDSRMSAFRDLISLTPQVTSLELFTGHYTPVYYRRDHESQDLTPIELPHLKQLSLQHADLSIVFEKLQLISNESLRNLRHLILDRGDYSYGLIPFHFLARDDYNFIRLVGPNLTILSLPTDGTRLQDAEIFQACPNLQKLIAYRKLRSNPPPSVSTLQFIYRDSVDFEIPKHERLNPLCRWINGKSNIDGVIEADFNGSWRNVKRIELTNSKPTIGVVRYMKENGVKLVLNGKF